MAEDTKATPDTANDDDARTELELAMLACPGPTSGDRWWRRRRHLVMMEYGSRLDDDGRPRWPDAAEYVRHQQEADAALA